jgi:outer membrane protein
MLLLGIGANVRAQRPLTLDSAVSFAFLHAPVIRTAALNIEEASLARREAELAPYPALKYNAGGSYAPTGRNFGYDPAVTNEGQLNGQLMVAGTIYNGGAYGLRKRQAELDVTHAQTGFALTREDLRFDVTQSFLEDLRDRMNITIEQESVSELQSYRDLVDRLFHGGTSGYTDLLKTEVQLGEENIALEKARADEIQARFALASLLGTPSDTGFSTQGTFDSVFTAPAYRMEAYDSLVTLTITLAQNELERARLDIDIARAAAKPQVDANIDAGLLTSVQNLTGPPDQRNPFWGASAGISVTGPILDWGLNKTQVEEKEVIVQILESQLDEQHRELNAQITQLLVLLRTSRDRLADVRANLQKARDSYELEKAKYAVGGALASEVLDAQKQVLDTRLSELQILSDIETYRADLRHLTAAPSPNTNTNNGK